MKTTFVFPSYPVFVSNKGKPIVRFYAKKTKTSTVFHGIKRRQRTRCHAAPQSPVSHEQDPSVYFNK